MTAPWLFWEDPKQEIGFQGIDYLELKLLPPQAPTEADLIIHLHSGYDDTLNEFTEDDIRITGGRRITEIEWSLTGQSGLGKTITLKLHTIGDASDYTVTLERGGGLPIHPFFANATFVFTVDCERGDCRPLAELPPAVPKQRPAVDLLTKDFAGFVGLLTEWVKVKNPHWADLAPASFERVLLDLLAHHGDMLSYYQDRVANEAFIDTATQRYSLREHALLLGTKLFDGTAAETMLAFTSSSDLYVPEDVEVTTSGGAGDASVVFYVTERTRVLGAHSLLVLAAWPGADTAVLPGGATEVLLWGKVDDLLAGQKLAFAVKSTEGTVFFSQVVNVVSFRLNTLPGWVAHPSGGPHTTLSDVTVVTIDPPIDRDLLPWDPDTPVSVFGNVARARAGRSSKEQLNELGLQEGTFSADRQSFTLERRPGFPEPLLRALRVPESPVVFRSSITPAGAIVSTPIIEVEIDNDEWRLVPHFDSSMSYDRHFIATADEDGSLWLEFGDGKKGRAVELMTDKDAATSTPKKMRLSYRVGDPITGNIGIGILNRFVPNQKALDNVSSLLVTNIVPGTGGCQPETKDAARLRIPASLRHGPIERAVALTDYADAALSINATVGTKVVERAKAKVLGGPFNAVLVLVDPVGQTGLSETLKKAVYDRVDALRMAGREHFVAAPDYVPVEVKLAICVEPGTLAHRVRDAVLAALRPGTSDKRGFFHPDSLSFGEELELGDVLAVVQRVPGVRSVKALRFRKLRVKDSGPVETRINLAPTEVLRMDGDDSFPENGKLSVLVVGSDPGVTETDFVIEEAP